MKVITITNRKGGVGKTNLAVALYEGLISKHYRVMGIDLDQQANFTESILKGAKPSLTIIDLITQSKGIKDAINDNFIGSNMNLSIINTERVERNILKNQLKVISPLYDYVIIDTPPSANALTYMALVCSDYVIMPTECDIYAVEGLTEMYKVIADAKKNYNPSLKINGIVITRYNPRTLITAKLESLLNQVANKYKTKVYKTKIRDSIAVKESRALHKPLLTYNGGKSNAQKDYKAFIKEFLESEE